MTGCKKRPWVAPRGMSVSAPLIHLHTLPRIPATPPRFYVRTSVRTYVHTCMHTYMHVMYVCMHACMHTCIHTYTSRDRERDREREKERERKREKKLIYTLLREQKRGLCGHQKAVPPRVLSQLRPVTRSTGACVHKHTHTHTHTHIDP
jgi:hypothetical protein